MSTAEELLCSRRWRLRNSLWMLWGILSFGMLAFVGWLYVGIRSRDWRWIAVGGALLAWFVGYGIVSQTLNLPGKGETATAEQTQLSGLVGGVILLVWAASAVGAWFANRSWLVWRAQNATKVPWYVKATAGSTPPPADDVSRVSAALDGALRGTLGSSPPASEPLATASAATTPSTTAPLDLNTASAQQLSALPGFSLALAEKIVRTRESTGHYRDTTDLVSRAGVKPHILAGALGQITVDAAASQTSDAGIGVSDEHPPLAPGRDGGRRLEF